MDASRKQSAAISALLHAGAVAFLASIATNLTPPPKTIRETYLVDPLKPLSPQAGGGGERTPLRVSKGNVPPKANNRPFVSPQVEVQNLAPKISFAAALEAPPELAFNPALQHMGDPNATSLILSGGPGGPSGIGVGKGPNFGPGDGPRSGVGNYGGPRIYRPGDGIQMPVAIFKVEPEYSDEARKAKIQGSVLISIEVGTDGSPRNLRVVRSVGLGLDEKALEAVSQWRFKPGLKDGRPVVVSAYIEVSFHLL